MPCACAHSSVITTDFTFQLYRVFITFLFYWAEALPCVSGQQPHKFRVRSIHSVQKGRNHFVGSYNDISIDSISQYAEILTVLAHKIYRAL
jgi:hypothetical protein